MKTTLEITRHTAYIPEMGYGERARTKKLNITKPPIKEVIFDPPLDKEEAMSIFASSKGVKQVVRDGASKGRELGKAIGRRLHRK